MTEWNKVAPLDHTCLSDGDYTLTDGHAWLEVANFAIRIHKTDEGVVVDIFRNGHEDEPSLASCYAYDTEAEGDVCQDCGSPRPTVDSGPVCSCGSDE